MIPLRQIIFLVVSNAIIVASLVVFMAGYFRPQPSLAAASVGDIDTSDLSSGETVAKAPFDKVVFMVVDALRSDFVYGEKSGFEFTQSLIRSGSAVPFTAMAALPTLTVSRLKALTQGTVQSFLDAWVNVANSPDIIQLKGEDTWLSRLKAAHGYKKKLVFYGVDMWLDLYPDIFDRYEGFFGFYMPDINTLDANITSRIPKELERDDWVSLVMHYEGLDSLAHQGGLRSSHMMPKQAEMDRVVQMIYQGILNEPHLKNTLVVLLGDHGMDEHGNHGGDTPGELASALTLISPHFQDKFSKQKSPLAPRSDFKFHSVINQVDIVPTLAGLLGFQIPAGNVGEFIPEMLDVFADAEDQMRVLLLNAKQMMKALKLDVNALSETMGNCGWDLDACQTEEKRILSLWKRVEEARNASADKNNQTTQSLQAAIHNFTRSAQHRLSRPTNNLGFFELYSGVAGICLSILLMLLGSSFVTVLDQSSETSVLFLVLLGTHGLSMFMPNVVKNEHRFWYIASLVWLSYLAHQRASVKLSGVQKCKPFLGVFLQLGSQALNSYGWLFPVGKLIDDLLFSHPIALWTLSILSYIPTATALSQSFVALEMLSAPLSWWLCGMSLGYKLLTTFHFNPELLGFMPDYMQTRIVAVDHVAFLRSFWVVLAGTIAYSTFRARFGNDSSQHRSLESLYFRLASLHLRTQARPKNLILFAIFDLQLDWLLTITKYLSTIDISLTVLVLCQSSFYASGRGNTFASLDFVNGFNGLDGTSVVAVTLQTLLANWVAPVWWSLAGLLLVRIRQAARLHGSDHGAESSTGTRSLTANALGSEDIPADSMRPQREKLLNNAYLEQITFDTAFAAFSSLAVMLSCLWLQDTAELWTVLAPKYVMACLWVSFYHVLVKLAPCTMLWCLTERKRT
ncbi:alkaline phosphatase-like protein [Colletotrichum zoysiae]|uniref:GPI ethanolamine phosphate transferase 2 n=1 Tax=Colletotrichum zoysiae TaxID=1216348 RepID=A0AAD9H9K2_9PEZI|nr:alkaline phosphatase-like protein [Colletotrichum zoysiae]